MSGPHGRLERSQIEELSIGQGRLEVPVVTTGACGGNSEALRGPPAPLGQFHMDAPGEDLKNCSVGGLGKKPGVLYPLPWPP